MKPIIYLPLALTLFILLTGCQTFLVTSNHTAGTRLIEFAEPNLNKDYPIIVASFVNIDNLDSSSSLGRISSQQVATQFTNSGFHVVEMLLRKNVSIQQEKGEFLLSRQLQKLGAEHHAQAVLVGTYAVGTKNVYFTTKVIDARTNRTLSSYDYIIPKDHDIKKLLGKNNI